MPVFSTPGKNVMQTKTIIAGQYKNHFNFEFELI
jgi:hypothetical protein